MAINTLEYAKIFQKELDKQMLATATSAWMEANAGQVKYSGGDEVKIPKISLVGLGDYDRDAGYKQGSVTLSYETKKMTMDRGRSFQLDAMDVDETNFIASAGAVMGEFQRTKVVPEIDAYRYASIFKAAGDSHKTTYTAAAASILDALDSDITTIQDTIGESEPMLIIMSYKVQAILDAAKNVDRYINVGEFQNGSVSRFTTISRLWTFLPPVSNLHIPLMQALPRMQAALLRHLMRLILTGLFCPAVHLSLFPSRTLSAFSTRTPTRTQTHGEWTTESTMTSGLRTMRWMLSVSMHLLKPDFI